MVRIHVMVNLFATIMLFWAGGTSLLELKNEVAEHGWTYEKTVIIDGVEKAETVNLSSKLISVLFVITVSVSLGYSTAQLIAFQDLSLNGQNPDIMFPLETPEEWHIDFLRPEKRVVVGMENYVISIPIKFLVDNMEVNKDG